MATRLLTLGKSVYMDALVHLEDFKWDCGWYWGGGYVGNRDCHYHIEHYFKVERMNAFDAFKADFGDTLRMTDAHLWRFCDLFKQFYAYRSAAECAQYGGHFTSQGRKEDEINTDLGVLINKQIEVVIREIRELCKQIPKDMKAIEKEKALASASL